MKRSLILCPDINRASFVLLFEKGSSGDSWSIRDYSQPRTVTLRYAREFDFDLRGLHQRTVQAVDAPAIATSDLDLWHRLTLETNARLLGVALAIPPKTAGHKPSDSDESELVVSYALLDEDRLRSLPKGRKLGDMRRIFESPNSEDWLTWNAFALAEKLCPNTWWRHLVSLAQEANP